MNPNVGGPMTPQNPFMSMLNQLRQGGGQQAPGQQSAGAQALMQRATNPPGAMPPVPGGAPVAQGAGQASGLPGAQQPEIQDASMPGQNPGTTKQLLGAANQLHQVITQLTDPEEIRMIRAILLMLTQLIQKDQEVQNGQTGSMQPQSPGQPSFSSPPPTDKGGM